MDPLLVLTTTTLTALEHDMAANTRPYFLTFNGVDRMVEAVSPAAAVRHVVGAAVTELRVARGAEVAAWVRGKKHIEIAGEKAATEGASTGSPMAVQIESTAGVDPAPFDARAASILLFEDWAGFDSSDSVDVVNTKAAADAVGMFATMLPAGRMDLMTFDVLRQQAPEFAFAIIASELRIARGEDGAYVKALNDVEHQGLTQVRERLEETPMPANDVMIAVLRHAGKESDTVLAAETGPTVE